MLEIFEREKGNMVEDNIISSGRENQEKILMNLNLNYNTKNKTDAQNNLKFYLNGLQHFSLILKV